VLARWSGWGSLPDVFDESNGRWADIRSELRGLLDDNEAWSAASRSMLNAHYTDPKVVMAMWDAVRQLGFETGRVLEPGCGSGNFIAYAPDGAAMVGVERDSTTAAIARALYPDAEIHTTKFEGFDARTPFDVAIGNVPFAKTVPADRRYNRGRLTLHNYFLSKSLQLLRPGGVMLALTSRYTLDARNPAARREISQHADLVGALRLPSTAMRATAGTDVVMDLLVLRRREPGAAPGGVTDWDRTVDTEVPNESGGVPEQIRMNQYLAERRDRILGTPVLGGGTYRAGDLLVHGDLANVQRQVADGLASILRETGLRYEPRRHVAGPVERRPRRVGDTELQGDRKVPLRQGSFVTSRTGVIYQHQHGELVVAGLGKGTSQEVRALIDLRDAAVSLLRLEADDAPDHEIEAMRTRLADGYQRYVRRWGPLNRVSWQRTGRLDPISGEERRRRVPARLGGFREDPEWPTLSAIEVYDEDTGSASPAAIQQRRVINPPAPHLGADTADEALAICLDERGRVDLDRIAELLGVDLSEAETEIADRVYEDPESGNLVTAEEYLSGDIRAKLITAKAAAERDPRFQRHVADLTGVQPPQVGSGEIVIRPGVPWAGTGAVKDFATQVLGIDKANVRYEASLGTWQVKGVSGRMSADFATRRMGAVQLLEATLNQRLVRIYDRDVDEKPYLNVEATMAAREKQEVIADRFSRWVWEDPERSARLVETYNKLFNSYVPPNYRGDHLTLPGLTSTFVPHGHQREAVARILREGRALLGHAVGAGKTATMVIAGQEMRRLGIVNRPTYVVPNHMLEQFSRELLQLYPHARVLVATRDLTGREGRKKFVARAATGDWDAVVITHSAFERLPLREDTLKAYTEHHTDELREALEEAKLRDVDGRTRKAMELALEGAENRLAAMLDRASKDDGISFEETGIDYLFVDELHLFKNKTISTAVEGVARQGSRRATDLDAKLWYLHRAHGSRAIVGATATPIANSISEAWVMQTYVQPDVLEGTGLDKFDAWAATFGQQVSAVELAPDGGSYRIATRLARYQNVPELIGLFRRTADIRGRDELDLKLPRLKGDSPEVVVVPASDGLKSYVESLVARARAVQASGVDPKIDNMLKITSDGRHAALDLRLVGGKPDPAGGKIEVAAQHIAQIYEDTRQFRYLDGQGEPSSKPGGFQFAFLDLSTPKDDGRWSAYDELKTRLVAKGIPAERVAFIHDAGSNDEARARLFARCRDGDVSVLVGSTEKMGVGTNIHQRAVALHHIDCPWRPADIEQREGRVLRQGNQNDEVQIFRYASEGSFDVYMWQTVERKGTFIAQLMRGDNVGRDIDDVGDAVLSFAEVKALASGNPLVMEQAGVQADLTKYERLEQAHLQEQHALKVDAGRLRTRVLTEQDRAASLSAAIELRIDTIGDKFTMEVAGTRYGKRPDAAKHLRTLVTAAFEQLQATRWTKAQARVEQQTVGKLGGFEVTLRGSRLMGSSDVTLTLWLGDDPHADVVVKSQDLEDDKLNLVARLENPLRRLDENLEAAQGRIAAFEEEIASVEARTGQPFPHAERLATLRRRHQEVVDQLQQQAAEDEAKAVERRTSPPEAPDPTKRLDDLKNRPDPDPPPGPSL
jgi:N12 class adenine-specific DNA methylase/SAM-dependent methyltransferase